MNRTIEIVAVDEEKTVKLTARISIKANKDDTDRMVETLTDKLVDALRDQFWASTIKIKRP